RDGVAADAGREPHVTRVADPVLAHEVEESRAPGDGAERVAAAEGLAEGREVGPDPVVLLGAAVGEAAAGDGLVEEQDQAARGGQLAEAAEEAGARRGAAVERLRGDPRHVVRGERDAWRRRGR